MGRAYAQLIAQLPAVELAGIVDVAETTGREAAASHGVAWYESTGALIAAGNVDGVIVANVEAAHAEPCLAALRHGVGVLVEKPIATTVADAEAIIDAATASRAALLVGHVLRFDARYALVRAAAASGEIGTPLTISARRLNGKGAQRRLKGRCSLPLFLGVHDYDLVRWIAGGEVTQVMAQSRWGFLSAQGYAVEDATWALLTFDNGVVAVVEAGWILPDGHPSGFDQRLEVTGTAGRAEVAGANAGLSITTDDRQTWPDAALWPTLHGRVGGALERQTAHFLDCLSHGTPPLVSGADGLAALRIALTVEQAARTGGAISVANGAMT